MSTRRKVSSACLAAFLVAAMIGTVCAAEGADHSAAVTLVERAITDAERDHWSYRPVQKTDPPAVDDANWNRNPIDRFIAHALERGGVRPLPKAGRGTLLRRVSFDLTGLPPTPAEVSEFLADSSADAYEKMVERKLARAAYGERYAQHWLDLARFAETDGFEHDLVRASAWRYRDWVIDALNRDLPFDEFLRLQLAGDELHPGDPAATVATGFLLCGPDMPDINLQEERRHQVLNEMTSTVGTVFLGMQFGCAQCHDHKFDPISIHDFYRLRAFFESADVFREHAIPTPEEAANRQAAEAAWTTEDKQAEKRLLELEELARKRFRDRNPDERPTTEQWLAELDSHEREEYVKLAERIAALPKLPELPRGRVFRSGSPQAGHVYLRGDFRQPGPAVEPGFPRVLPAEPADRKPESRASLAAWMTRTDHPLTSRVIANRIWQWHFGVGLLDSPSDLGVMGSEPTHPELLDWLAAELVRSGWSMKHLHRLIVTSQVYQLASAPYDAEWSAESIAAAQDRWQASMTRDPGNALLWRRHRLRLDGEQIRDAMLHSSGKLSSRRGGAGVKPPLPREVTSTLLKDQWPVTADSEDHRRRSIYLFVRRNLRYPLFDVFDRPDTHASCPMRHESTTATQSLVQLNSAFSLDCARYLADVLIESEFKNGSDQINQAYLRTFGRRADAEELRLAEEFLQRQARLLARASRSDSDGAEAQDDGKVEMVWRTGLVDLCLALFNASEFVYAD